MACSSNFSEMAKKAIVYILSFKCHLLFKTRSDDLLDPKARLCKESM